jgi:peptidoglycan/LPS O-acetylase OafA/YrhL
MGFLRLLLALVIVAIHSKRIQNTHLYIPAREAVEVFYAISGFYMALILSEKYTGKRSYSLFISNRLLRLMPTYWVVLAMTVLFSCFGWLFRGHLLFLQGLADTWHSCSATTLIAIVTSNLIMFGQDMLLFLKVNPVSGGLIFDGHGIVNMFGLLVVPQAWSVGLEMLFYLCAPLLVKKRAKVLMLIFILCIALRLVCYGHGFMQDPWSYRFFPFEMAFFMSGILGYKWYAATSQRPVRNREFLLFAIPIFVTVTVHWALPGQEEAKSWMYAMSMTPLLPFLFRLSKSSKLDRFIGELSYPVYISHFLVMGVVDFFFRAGSIYEFPVTSFLSILFSIILFYSIVKPIDRFRQNRVANLIVPQRFAVALEIQQS